MAVQVYGVNHVAIEVDNAQKSCRDFIKMCLISKCCEVARGQPGVSSVSINFSRSLK